MLVASRAFGASNNFSQLDKLDERDTVYCFVSIEHVIRARSIQKRRVGFPNAMVDTLLEHKSIVDNRVEKECTELFCIPLKRRSHHTSRAISTASQG